MSSRSAFIFIEALEGRNLMSAVWFGSAPPVASEIPAQHAPLVQHRSRSHASLVPESIVGVYGGFYQIYTASGAFAMDITTIKGNTFSGNLLFHGYDGSDIQGGFKAVMSRNLDFKMTVKAPKTAMVCTGGYHPESNTLQITVLVRSGRFDGHRLPRFITGEFVGGYGYDTVDTLPV